MSDEHSVVSRSEYTMGLALMNTAGNAALYAGMFFIPGGEFGEAAELGLVAEEAVPTIGDILAGSHPDTMIHLTNDAAEAFSEGVDEGTFFARLGDVSHMTVSDYQANVVMPMAAAGPGQPVAGFVLANPGSAGAFTEAGIFNNANVMEYTNGMRFAPSGYVPLP